jgi:acyl-CoA synthetase (AMP-forming)/AMP-acid ligase II
MSTSLLAGFRTAAAGNGPIPHRFVGEARDLTVSTHDLLRDSRRFAAALRALGVQPGETLAVQLPNWPEFVVSFCAALELGLIFVPIVHTAGAAESSFIVSQSGARVMVVAGAIGRSSPAAQLHDIGPVGQLQHVVAVGGPRFHGQVQWDEVVRPGIDISGDAALAARPIANPAVVLYTSGSTSEPKGVVHSEASIAATVTRWIDRSAEADGPVVLMHLPVGHVGGVLFASRLFLHPGRMVFLEHWRAERAAALVAEERVTAMPATPFHLETLFEAADRLHLSVASLVSVALSSTAIPPSVVEAATGRRIAAFRGYGSTEHPVVSWGHPLDPLELRIHSDGQLMPDVEIRCVDEDDLQVANGEVGEIMSRGPGLMSGYLDKELDKDVLCDGWYRSGDLGRVSDGVLTVTGRKKDVIIRGGENISSREIEDVLATHPAVAEIAVIGLPDDRYGERVLAVVVARDPSLSLTSLADHLAAAGLARHKRPDALATLSELPRTAVGKINKEQLRRALRAGTLHISHD